MPVDDVVERVEHIAVRRRIVIAVDALVDILDVKVDVVGVPALTGTPINATASVAANKSNSKNNA